MINQNDEKQDETKCADFAQRLDYALTLRGYPSLGKGRISYIQEVFSLSRAGANKWLHGKAIPHRRKRIEIAEKLGVNLGWLETGEGDPLNIETSQFEANNNNIEAPIFSLAEVYSLEKYTTAAASDSIILNNKFSRHIFAVKQVGDSMFPRFTDGSILLVDPHQKPRDGDYVIAKSQHFPEAVFRQYTIGSSCTYLVAFNQKFEPIRIDTNTEIIGKVIEVRTGL